MKNIYEGPSKVGSFSWELFTFPKEIKVKGLKESWQINRVFPRVYFAFVFTEKYAARVFLSDRGATALGTLFQITGIPV